MQILVFLVLNIITIVVVYPWIKKNFKNTSKNTQLTQERYLGMILLSEETFKGKTRIKLEGSYWTVDSGFEEIKKGERFIINKIEGNKFLVSKEC